MLNCRILCTVPKDFDHKQNHIFNGYTDSGWASDGTDRKPQGAILCWASMLGFVLHT
jgi:hypothetical protein